MGWLQANASKQSLIALIIPPGVKDAFPEDCRDVEHFRERLQDPTFRSTRFQLCPRCCEAAVSAPKATKLGASPSKSTKQKPSAELKPEEPEESLLEWDGHLVEVNESDEPSDSDEE